jgi:hypothetical protein
MRRNVATSALAVLALAAGTFVPVSGVVVGVPWFGTYACR